MITSARRVGVLTVTALALLAGSRTAAAQGNGQGHGYGLSKKNVSTSAPSAAGSQEISLSGAGYRNFGSWLDDATVMPEGDGFVSVALSYWRTPSFREVDVPVVDAGMALHRRIQIGVSAPVYHAGEPGGPSLRGLGDVYLSTKIQLRNPTKKRVGFAMTPFLEILSTPLPDGGGRLSFGLPVSVEAQRTGWRAFGSAGYLSRGALFASGAVEVEVSERAWLTGSISQSHSIKRDDLSFALGLSKTRTDVSAGLAIGVLPNVAAFGSIGRTISKRDASSASLMFTAGLSLSVR